MIIENTKIYDKFEYHLEDLDCDVCLHNGGKKQGCKLKRCRYDDIRREAIKHGRITRKRGWFRCRE